MIPKVTSHKPPNIFDRTRAELANMKNEKPQPMTPERLKKLMERTPLEEADARRHELGDSGGGGE